LFGQVTLIVQAGQNVQNSGGVSKL